MGAAVGCCLFDTEVGRCGIAWTAGGSVQAVQLPETGDEGTLARMRRRCGDVPVGTKYGHSTLADTWSVTRRRSWYSVSVRLTTACLLTL